MDFKRIASQFDLDGEVLSVEPYGCGHINTTYLVETNIRKYILQRINTNLFKDVKRLMNNITSVCAHLVQKIKLSGGDPEREALTVIYTKDGLPYLEVDGSYYRVYLFVVDSVAYQISPSIEVFYESAVAFGKFQNNLSDFPVEDIYEPILNFHNTPNRLLNFEKALEADVKDRAKSVSAEIDFVLSRRDYCDRITRLLDSGEMPYRVTHNDTKLNNVLFDRDTGSALAVIDLDTIMKGSMCYDFGDSIRFGCNTASEDEVDLSKVNFSIEMYEEYVKGFVGALKQRMTRVEADNLAFSAILMTYECGMRFLTDYLDGDVYFHTSREGHNLDRARTQFKLTARVTKSVLIKASNKNNFQKSL